MQPVLRKVPGKLWAYPRHILQTVFDINVIEFFISDKDYNFHDPLIQSFHGRCCVMSLISIVEHIEQVHKMFRTVLLVIRDSSHAICNTYLRNVLHVHFNDYTMYDYFCWGTLPTLYFLEMELLNNWEKLRGKDIAKITLRLSKLKSEVELAIRNIEARDDHIGISLKNF